MSHHSLSNGVSYMTTSYFHELKRYVKNSILLLINAVTSTLPLEGPLVDRYLDPLLAETKEAKDAKMGTFKRVEILCRKQKPRMALGASFCEIVMMIVDNFYVYGSGKKISRRRGSRTFVFSALPLGRPIQDEFRQKRGFSNLEYRPDLSNMSKILLQADETPSHTF